MASFSAACKCKWAALVVLLVLLPALPEGQSDRVLLRDVTSVTLRRGEYTTGRRSAPVPQLTCVGGTAYGKYAPKVVQCYNRGFDGRDVQWECQAELSNDYQFGKIEVSCEGYDFPNDLYILVGSCGLKYELDYTASGAKRQSSYQSPSAPYEDSTGSKYTKWIYLLIAAFVIYLIYTTLTAPREGNEGDRRRGGGSTGYDDYPGGGGPHPPGWRAPPPPPSYDETFGKGTAGTNQQSGAGQQTAPGGGPGFFTGLGLGALGGYFFGNQGNADTGWNGYGTRRRRNDPGYNTGGGGYFDSAGPSTSSGRGSSSGSGTHTSSGFGGTSRR